MTFRSFVFACVLLMPGAGGWLEAADPVVAPHLWRNVVIKGGGFVSGLVYHPAEPGLLYARTDVGGAYRWRPDTRSWVPLNDALGGDDAQLTGVLSLALDPQDANRVYLACGQYLPWWASNGAVLSSNDRGATWTITRLAIKLGGNSDGRSTGERLQVDPNDPAVLFLGTNQDGLWKSADRAATWSRVAGFAPSGVTLVVFDPRGGTAGAATPTIFAGVDSTSGASLYRSQDGGATWSAVPGQPTGLIPRHAKLGADGFLYVTYGNALGPNGVTSGAVWKLKTADDTWTNITPPAGQGGFAGLGLDAQHPGTLAVSTLDRWWPGDEIYRSTDGGATWKALNALSTRDGSSAPYSNGSTPHWIGALEIDPFDGARAFYVTGYGVFGTETLTAADNNGPIVWSFRNDGLEETVPLGLVSPPSGAPLVSVIGDVDGFRHDDLATSPARGRHAPSVGTNSSIDFAEAAPATMVRTHGGGTVRGSRSTDGGATWTYFGSAPAAATADNPGAIAISADAARLVWAPAHAALYVSADDGASWTASTGGPAASSGTSYTPVSDRVNARRFYVYDGAAGRVYASNDGGSSFALAASGLPTGGDALRAVPGKEGHLWLPAWSGGLYRSTDGGGTFTAVAGVQEGGHIGFGKAAAGATYPAVFLWGRIGGIAGVFRSDDEGATWTRVNDDAHQFGWINAITGDPRVYGRVYLATGGRGIVYGEPAGATPTVEWTVPVGQAVAAGANTTLSVAVAGSPAPTLQWWRNGNVVAGATQATLTLTNVQPADAGLYALVATGGGATASAPAIVGVTTTAKVVGAGEIAGADIVHPNGRMFDQVLVNGRAAAITADAGQVTRASFIDLDNDIVQVEFSGPGTLSLVLDDDTAPARPLNYNQELSYAKGHAGLVITGATEATNVSVFSVGRATAFDPTGAYNFLQEGSATNDPAKNGNPLFAGHPVADYDGIADIAFIAIASADGKFGGVRTSNANYFAGKGWTGIYAPGVALQGPLFVGDLSAFDAATPVLRVGAVTEARITGGDLSQDNGRAVEVSGIAQLRMTAGGDSQGRALAAQPNQAVLKQDGQDVTAQIVVNPTP